MTRILAACLLAGLAASAHAGLELYLAAPPRPGTLTGCELYFFARTEGRPWRRVDQPVRLAWPGGGLELNPGAAPGPGAGALREHCFRLELDGRILAGGAVIAPESARYLTFPVLLAADADGRPVLSLAPNWTATGAPAGPGFGTLLATLHRRFPGAGPAAPTDNDDTERGEP